MRDLSPETEGSMSTAPHLAHSPPILTVQDLTFSAQKTVLLNAVSLNIREGSRTLIMGPNGAGKSLLLRLMHGLIKPDAGTITWKGRANASEARRFQSMVFQRPVLLRRSVFANLSFALGVHGLRGKLKADKIRAALHDAGLAHLETRPARVLSGGQQQRLSLVRALATDPEILFLDEPTANLDPASTSAIEQLIMKASARGVTIVLVTHDQGQAKRLGEDLVFLQDGEVAETGPAQTILTAPQSEPVKAWVDGRIYLGSKAGY
ncbi:phosphate ABC transporter ATP-binding protein [Roseibium denhamense]|uniref:Tungstate transport system ATP-binding protein n=1 Tax=Roseibium denhamense TaxID=76305 RepID=A0ABY1NHV7_9HYPH|nr:phosphate ABC transporter ATP-binding protein [Roseibium denhamense]MTI06458.1 phosphate ABC transporter ATP-binding protein [Roseibium denhamense]SMP09296.1 tungstate transport system ATP-binding protein [Roseibium denhamense]